VQPSSRDLFVLISYIDSVGVANPWEWLKSIGHGSTYMVAMPYLASSKCTLVGYIEIDKTNKLGIQAKVQFQDVGVAQLFVMPRPLEKNPVHRGVGSHVY